MPFNWKEFKKRMAERGHSQYSLAKASGVQQSAIGRMLVGENTNLTIKTIDALADALGCESRDLLERKKK